VTRELTELEKNPPEDIKLLLNEEDITDIQAIITGPEQTPYAGGQFRVKLKLGNDFPQSPPQGFFLTKIFHPNVSPKDGSICVDTLKKGWTENLGIKDILLVTGNIFPCSSTLELLTFSIFVDHQMSFDLSKPRECIK